MIDPPISRICREFILGDEAVDVEGFAYGPGVKNCFYEGRDAVAFHAPSETGEILNNPARRPDLMAVIPEAGPFKKNGVVTFERVQDIEVTGRIDELIKIDESNPADPMPEIVKPILESLKFSCGSRPVFKDNHISVWFKDFPEVVGGIVGIKEEEVGPDYVSMVIDPLLKVGRFVFEDAVDGEIFQ